MLRHAVRISSGFRNSEFALKSLPKKTPPERLTGQELLSRMQAFGYTSETMNFMLLPLIKADKDPIGSMGNDAALACLSDQPRMLYDYFHQLFAQVTNPPIDSIREEVIMSLECYIGPEGNLLDTKAGKLSSPGDASSDSDQPSDGQSEGDQSSWLEVSGHRHYVSEIRRRFRVCVRRWIASAGSSRCDSQRLQSDRACPTARSVRIECL
jgi:hypothetical protein